MTFCDVSFAELLVLTKLLWIFCIPPQLSEVRAFNLVGASSDVTGEVPSLNLSLFLPSYWCAHCKFELA